MVGVNSWGGSGGKYNSDRGTMVLEPTHSSSLIRQGSRYHIRYSDKTWSSGHFSNLVFYESLMDFLGYNDVMHPKKDNRVQNIDAQ